MNGDIEKICGLLDEMKALLIKFESETIEILSCDADSIERHTISRVNITQELDKTIGSIDEICENMENGAVIRKIIRNVSAFTDVSGEEEKVFLKSQEIFSLLNRIKDSDVQAVGRINLEKELLMKKIKEANQGQQAKAAKFSVGTDEGLKKHFQEEKKMI